MEKHILILEDSPTCQRIAVESLKHLGLVQVAKSCEEARSMTNKREFDLILLDIHLPDGNGFEFFEELKNRSSRFKTPVIFSTADEDVTKVVAAFAVGASDYVTKPYSPLELRARAQRLFRYNESDALLSDPRSGLYLNALSYRVTRNEKGLTENLDLTPSEFKILFLLMKHPDRIYSRDQIIDSIWGEDVFVTERTVDTHVSSLRKKLGGLSRALSSVRGEGYVWRSDFKRAAA